MTERSWAVADQGVWFLWPAGPASTELRFFNSGSSKVSTVASIAKPTSPGLDLSPDGRTLVYGQIDHQRSEIILVEGFK